MMRLIQGDALEVLLDKIMALFVEFVCGDKIMGPNEIRPKIEAILAEPCTTADLIAAQGVKPGINLASPDLPDFPEPEDAKRSKMPTEKFPIPPSYIEFMRVWREIDDARARIRMENEFVTVGLAQIRGLISKFTMPQQVSFDGGDEVIEAECPICKTWIPTKPESADKEG